MACKKSERVELDALRAHNNPEEATVFGSDKGSVQFRTMSWYHTAIFMIQMTLGLSVLSMPSALYQLGAVAGTLFIVFWACMTAYLAGILGRFVLQNPSTHTISDACYIAILAQAPKELALIVRRIVECLNIFTWIMTSGALILGLSIALNAISKHATCTVVFNFVSYVWIASWAGIRKIEKLSWFCWLGFTCIISALLVVVIAVSIPNRPAAAPKTGSFELGFNPSPPAGTNFPVAWSSALAIFSTFSNINGFVPVVSEMRHPQHYFRSVYLCMGLVGSISVSLSLTMFAYTGKWVASPALGSAGETIKIVAYAIAIPSLTASGAIMTHIAAKSVFVRALHGTKHLTSNTKLHWIAWLSCTYGIGAIGWVLSEAIPFFNSLVSLIASLGFGPLSLCIPPLLWFSLERKWARTGIIRWLAWIFHGLVFLLGLFATARGTYANVVQIVDEYGKGDVGRPFSCADNSGTRGYSQT